MEIRIEEDIPILGRVSVNFFNLSAKIYELYKKENEITRQKSISHLGLISKAFNGINHSRYEYLIFQCVTSELIENNFKGTTSAQGNIKINKKEYSGNDIIKGWFLMSNFGHCKNTIGDEKSLLVNVIQKRSFRSYLIGSIKDEQLKDWANNVIDKFDYVSFHHILSIRRIYKCLKRSNILKAELIAVYKLLLLESDLTSSYSNKARVEDLKLMYKNIRDLCILALDSRNTSLPFSIDVLSSILSFNNNQNRYRQIRISDIFDPMLSLLYNNLYLHPKSQTIQRSYEVLAIDNIKGISSNSEIIERALTEGLSKNESFSLLHFLRLEFHTDYMEQYDFKNFLRLSHTVKRGVNNVDASLDFNPLNSRRVLDFYIDDLKFQKSNFPKFLFNISGILEKQISATLTNFITKRGGIIKGVKKGIDSIGLDETESKKIIKILTTSIFRESWGLVQSNNIPPFREILWAVLRFHLKSEFSFDIDSHSTTAYQYFGVKLTEDFNFLNQNIEKAITDSIDEDRIHELHQVRKSCNRKFDGVTIACFSRVIVYDYSKSPDKRRITDFDSIVLKFNENNMYLELNEAKNIRNPFSEAKNCLLKKAIPLLKSDIKGAKIYETKNYGAKLVIKY